MALAYVPPGVRVEEVVSPNIAPLLASPANVCVIGVSQGHRRRTDQIRLTDTGGTPTDVPLPGLPIEATVETVFSVKDALDPSKGAASGGGYVVTDDYTVDLDEATVTRVDGGDIDENTLVNVEYTYLPSNYFTATRHRDFGSVEDYYGSAYAADGNTIATSISYAAGLAFENGAAEVVCQPLFQRDTPGDPLSPRENVTSASWATSTSWADTLYALRDIEDINVIVPVIGQSEENVTDAAQLAVFKAVQDHIQFMRSNDQYILGIFGEDSSLSAAAATQDTLRQHALDLQGRYAGASNQQLVFVEPSRFSRISPVTGAIRSVGGQYVAAGFAGMIAARPVSASLTNKQVSGVSGVLVPRLKAEKNEMAQNGLTVVEQRGGAVIVRHAITMDNRTTATREVSVVRAKHRLIESIRDTLVTQVIGEVIADDQAPLVVRGAVIGVLERLRGERDIVGYANVDARTLTLDPTTIEVRFSYRPAFPVNYINVVFSLDLTSGDVTQIQT